MTNTVSTARLKLIFIALAVFVCLFPRSLAAAKNPDTPDLIHIQIADDTARHEMPGAGFLHDKHTAALKDQHCSACHLKEKDRFVFKFQRVKDGGYETDKRLYHEKCAGCHEERGKKGLSSGPFTSQCRLCHTQTGGIQSTAQPVAMDKSLHYRHEISTDVKPKTAGEDTNCSACHHEFGKTLNKPIYVKGKESACRYCHKTTLVEKTRSFQTVAHESCLNCHYLLHSTKQKAGPTDCGACHDAKRLAGIAKVADVPRIKRNQPDSVLMSLWLKDIEASQKPSKQFVNPVAFNHKLHEAKSEHCYACHHDSMEPCGACHTRLGTEKSQLTRLDRAMHFGESRRSCRGCHSEQVKSKDCAGCHFQMVKSDFTTSDCAKCHSIEKKWLDPMPEGKEAWTKIADEDIGLRTARRISAPDNRISIGQVPEEVTIQILADQYEGAKFPHRKIVTALSERIQKNELASHSHDGIYSVCNGCHHYSLDAASPPKCASCHGISKASDPDGRPGLQGAYHHQCINCHEQMELPKPATADCTACHQKRTKAAQ